MTDHGLHYVSLCFGHMLFGPCNRPCASDCNVGAAEAARRFGGSTVVFPGMLVRQVEDDKWWSSPHWESGCPTPACPASLQYESLFRSLSRSTVTFAFDSRCRVGSFVWAPLLLWSRRSSHRSKTMPDFLHLVQFAGLQRRTVRLSLSPQCLAHP